MEYAVAIIEDINCSGINSIVSFPFIFYRSIQYCANFCSCTYIGVGNQILQSRGSEVLVGNQILQSRGSEVLVGNKILQSRGLGSKVLVGKQDITVEGTSCHVWGNKILV